MERIVLQIVSESSGEMYTLVADSTGAARRFTCSCPAGAKAQLCKHRIGVMDGKSTPENRDAVESVRAWIKASPITALMADIENAENEMDRAKKRAAKLKLQLGRMLNEGF